MGIESIRTFEIIICDDHSSDHTFEKTVELNKSYVRCVRLSRRSGSHTAIRTGLAISKGDMVLCISADGQDDPSILPTMINKIRSGKHIVWGVRAAKKEAFIYHFLSSSFYRLLEAFVPNENNIDLANADFYLLDKRVVGALNSCKERNTSLFGLIAWLGYNQDQVVYERNERYSGKSKWNFGSQMRLALDWIIGFSGIPLKIISMVGWIFSLIGFLYALYIVLISLIGMTTPGWAEGVIIALIIGGVQLIMIGIIGEYLWRTLSESRDRPLYFIEKDFSPDQE